MSRLTKAIAIASVTAFTAFGVGACGGDSGGGGGSAGGGGGEINVSMTSFPDYIDPQLSYTVEGWETLWNVYTPLLTYKHAKGEEGTAVVPGLAKDMPEVSADGKTYKLTLRPNMKYSDGTPIKASDFTYAIQRLFKANSGGSVFYEGIVGAKDYADGKSPTITGITTDDATGDITIALEKPNGTFNNVLALMFAAPVPPSTPLDKDATNTPPASSGPFMITKVEAPQTMTMERNPNFQTVKDAGATEVADAQVDKITITQNKSNSAQVTGVEQNTIDYMVDPPDADRLAEVKSKFGERFRLDDSINTYYFFMNNKTAPFNDVRVRQADQLRDRSRGAEPGVRRPPASDAADPAAGDAGLRGVQALSGSRHGRRPKPLSPRPIRRTRTSPSGPTTSPTASASASTTTTCSRSSASTPRSRWWPATSTSRPSATPRHRIWTPGSPIGIQDFPHPDDFFRPLLNGENILPTNNSNYSQVAIPANDATMDKLSESQLTDDVKKQYAALDKAYMEQAVWAPYGNEEKSTFVSDRIDFENTIPHLLFSQDYSAFALK